MSMLECAVLAIVPYRFLWVFVRAHLSCHSENPRCSSHAHRPFRFKNCLWRPKSAAFHAKATFKEWRNTLGGTWYDTEKTMFLRSAFCLASRATWISRINRRAVSFRWTRHEMMSCWTPVIPLCKSRQLGCTVFKAARGNEPFRQRESGEDCIIRRGDMCLQAKPVAKKHTR